MLIAFLIQIYLMLRCRNLGESLPEHHLPLMIPASIFVSAGFLWYGWSVQTHLHWIMPNIGIAIFSAGVIVAFQCVQTYIIDAYPRYAASAMSAVAFLRALTGFSFPLFAGYMYDSLGFGWGNTLLSMLALAIGLPMSLSMWQYGHWLRLRSPYAAG